MTTSQNKRGAQAFEQYYSQLFGERWAGLRAAMVAGESSRYELTTFANRPYHIDPASVLAASTAASVDARRILDLCAAPGGKTLVLALSCGAACSIVANDRSESRRKRLLRVLDEHLDYDTRQSVLVTGHDARRWGLYESGLYDLVLADVPCSSEAHLLTGKGRLDQWSPSRINHVSRDQFAILRAATQAVYPGGKVLYATCSLPQAENEDVIERALERGQKKGPALATVNIDPTVELLAQRLGLHVVSSGPGYRIWPDENNGAGPMYFCLLQREENTLP